jgi:hypothetical protein
MRCGRVHEEEAHGLAHGLAVVEHGGHGHQRVHGAGLPVWWLYPGHVLYTGQSRGDSRPSTSIAPWLPRYTSGSSPGGPACRPTSPTLPRSGFFCALAASALMRTLNSSYSLCHFLFACHCHHPSIFRSENQNQPTDLHGAALLDEGRLHLVLLEVVHLLPKVELRGQSRARMEGTVVF